MQAQWEERLAAYVKASFLVTLLGAFGQNSVQYVSRITTALLMLFGAKAVIDGELTIGALVAFNMISAQVTQPVLRLAQLWQDFQQVQVPVERLGDTLNALAGARHSGDLVFPVTLSPTKTSVSIDGAPVPLVAGMAVRVEIRTGTRRILSDIFSPLVEVASTAMWER